MGQIQYKKLDANCFNAHSLDSFVRHQTVTECWRKLMLQEVYLDIYARFALMYTECKRKNS